MCDINNNNRDSVQHRYIDAIVDQDVDQIKKILREYLDNEKSHYTHEELEDEIKARGLWITSYLANRYHYT